MYLTGKSYRSSAGTTRKKANTPSRSVVQSMATLPPNIVSGADSTWTPAGQQFRSIDAPFLPARSPARRRLIPLMILLLTSGCALHRDTQVATDRTSAAVKQPKVELQEWTLANGLQVILVEQHHAPVISLSLTYHVGSRDEVAGRTGFAHLFEHMMFQGSNNVGKAEHFLLISNAGGSMNGTTSFDRTNYFQTLPKNQLELALFLESDRMRSLEISQANLDNQRNAVQEERRLRYDNRPYGIVLERLLDLTFDNFAYKHSTIGSMADLNAATLTDVQNFFQRYYAPNNATLVLVGDTTRETALPLVRKYFADIPQQPEPTLPDLSERLNKGERRSEYTDKMAPQARIDFLYPTITGSSPDFYSLQLLGTILGGSDGSRLYQRLVKNDGIATDAGAFALQLRGPSPFWVYAMVSPGKDTGDVEGALTSEIQKIANDGVTEEELARAKTTARVDLVDSLETSMRTAIEIGQFAAYFGNPALINEQSLLYAQVTASDIQRVAKTYLQNANRAVLTVRPDSSSNPAGANK